MKIRNGFVSNSSSSSFIVSFKKVPKTKEELKKMLFGDRQEYHSTYDLKTFTTEQVTDIVWADLKEHEPLTLKKAKEAIQSGYPVEDQQLVDLLEIKEPNINEFSENKDYEGFEKAYRKFKEQFYTLLDKKSITEKRTFLFEYSDNDGDLFCAMEHGTLFDNVDLNIKISHH